MRFLLLFLPFQLLAQFDLCPWTPWVVEGPQYEAYLEHSGFGAGWNAAGVRWHSYGLSAHISASPRGQPSMAALGRMALTPKSQLHVGWGLEQKKPHLYGQWNTTLTDHQELQLQLRFAQNHTGWACTYSELLESGWHIGATALYAPSTGIHYVLQIRPPGMQDRGRLFVSTSGDWRVEWRTPHVTVSFGTSSWPWLRSSLLWGKEIAWSKER